MCAGASGWQFHQCHAYLVVQSRFCDALPAVDQIVDVVEGIKISDGRNAVFFKQFGVQLDDVARLRFQSHYIHAAGQGLQIGL